MAASPTVEAESPRVGLARPFAHPRAYRPLAHSLWEQPCPRSAEPGHRLSVVGYLHGRRPERLECYRPLLLGCADGCAAQSLMPCGSRRSKQCPPCAKRYATRLRRLVGDALDRRLTAGVGAIYLVTFTAPGDHEHRRLNLHGTWYPGMRRPLCACHQHMSDGMGVWNARASGRWNHLRTSLARDFPGMEFFRAVEVQNGARLTAGAEGRGALHLHVPLWLPVALTPDDRDRIQARALAAGFGCSVDIQHVTSGDLSRYVTKAVSGYVTKAADARVEVPWVDLLSGEMVEEPRYRTWSASSGWGMTMRTIKDAVRAAARADAARLAARRVELEDQDAVDTLFTTAPDPPPPRHA